MANKRKTTTVIVAGVTAAALVLGGTFAWTSISQQARNEAIVDINPGGRLHDDFNGTNKDVYVENFGDQLTGVDIFARIRLDQYFEVGQDAGEKKTEADRKVDVKLGGNISDEDTWIPYKPVDAEGNYITIGTEVSANTNWKWQLGNDDNNKPIYLPTFNMNKDSLAADINGTYEGTVKDDIVHYDDYKVYEEKDYTGTEIHDWDEDTDEETAEKNNWDNGGIITDETKPIDSGDVLHKANQSHTAKPISTTATVISMEEWLGLLNDEDPDNDLGDFWVYDQDGWAYWANPIAPGQTTGLLLDGIEMSRTPDDNWYYAINVVGQFATASDVYEFDGMTEEAQQLVDKLTGKVENEMLTLTLDNYNNNTVFAPIGTPVKIEADNYDYTVEDGTELTDTDISSLWLVYYNGEVDGEPVYEPLSAEQYTYEDNVLTIIDEALSGVEITVRDKSVQIFGVICCWDENIADDEQRFLTVNGDYADENGYIYLTGLDIEKNNSFEVSVDSNGATLSDEGITAVFHEDNITNTTLVVDEDDPYKATLTIASNDYHSVQITANYEDGTSETVTVVPVYNTIIITPAMNGSTITLESGRYQVEAKDFTSSNVTFTLNNANRSVIQEIEGTPQLLISGYESGKNISIVASDETQQSTVNIKIVNNFPYDGPTYSYYIKGSGETYGRPLMENQDYYWEQSSNKTYEVSIGMTNDFTGKINVELVGITDGAAGFVGEGDTLSTTAEITGGGVLPEIKLTDAQDDKFTIKIDITGIDGEKYETSEYKHEIYIHPYAEGSLVPRNIAILSNDSDLETGDTIYLAPGESAELYFKEHFDGGVTDASMDNSLVTWSVISAEETEGTMNYTIQEGASDAKTATITHSCEKDSCKCTDAAIIRITVDATTQEFDSSLIIAYEGY